MKIYRAAKLNYDEGNYQRSYDIIFELEKQGFKDLLYVQVTWARYYCELALGMEESKRTAIQVKDKINEIAKIENENVAAYGGYVNWF